MTFDPPENIGGIEGRAVNYTKELVARGHQVVMLSLTPSKRFGRSSLMGAPLLKYPSLAAFIPVAFLRALALLERSRLDSVLVLSGSQTPLGVLLLGYAKVRGRRSMAFFYGRDILSARESALNRTLGLLSVSLATKVVANSVFTKGLLPRPRGGECMVIYPSVTSMPEVEAAPEGEAGKYSVLFVGRLVPRKGLDLLLKAMKSVISSFEGTELVVVGDGPERESMAELASLLGISSRVRFLGVLRGKDLEDAYRGSTLLALPSRRGKDDAEGFGTVFLEAAAFGKPVVGTRSGGIPEAVLDGKTGILVEEGDVKALGEAICRLLGDGGLRERLGASARERVAAGFRVGVAADLIEKGLGR